MGLMTDQHELQFSEFSRGLQQPTFIEGILVVFEEYDLENSILVFIVDQSLTYFINDRFRVKMADAVEVGRFSRQESITE